MHLKTHLYDISQLLTPLFMCTTSYRPPNMVDFGIATYCNYCHVSKDQQKVQDKQCFICSYMLIVHLVKAKEP